MDSIRNLISEVKLNEKKIESAGFNDILSLSVKVKGAGAGTYQKATYLKDISNLDPTLQRNASKSITKLTPIQSYAIPAILSRLNVLGCSQTGSGKTASFLIPLLNILLKEEKNQRFCLPAMPQAIILVPTRELAIQIYDVAIKFVAQTPLEKGVHIVCGGRSMESEFRRLSSRPCNLMVATVGRLLDLISRETVSLDEVLFFVLDEADEMMAKGFVTDIIHISRMCTKKVNSMMFSATYPNAVMRAAERILGSSYAEIFVGEVMSAAVNLTQKIELVENCEKDRQLKLLLQESELENEKSIIFISTIEEVERVCNLLLGKDLAIGILHSNMPQSERESILLKLKNGEIISLLSTSVAARGIDIPSISIVVNYDLPDNIEEYILRIGRTGRGGREGRAVSFFEFIRDGPFAAKLIDLLKNSNQKVPKFLYKAKESQIDDVEEMGLAVDPYGAPNMRFFKHEIKPCEFYDDNWD